MTIREAINIGAKTLSSASDKRHLSPVLDSEVLLCFVIKKDKAQILAHGERTITATQKRKFTTLIRKRAEGVPVAYLTGTKEFFGLEFLVNHRVLIPRPETECMVEELIKRLPKSQAKILDVGTGSGCVVISLAKNLPNNRYFASDLSPKALALAKKNARSHKAAITFRRSDLLESWKNQAFDVIAANLPYGWEAWTNARLAEGLKFEPKEALFAPGKGLGLIEKLLGQIKKRKGKPALIALEFDPRQTIQIEKLAGKQLPDFDLQVFKDLSGKDRFCLLSRKLF